MRRALAVVFLIVLVSGSSGFSKTKPADVWDPVTISTVQIYPGPDAINPKNAEVVITFSTPKYNLVVAKVHVNPARWHFKGDTPDVQAGETLELMVVNGRWAKGEIRVRRAGMKEFWVLEIVTMQQR